MGPRAGLDGRRVGGPQGRSGREENLVPPGIRSRTVQPGSSVAIPTELPGPRTPDVETENSNYPRSLHFPNTAALQTLS